MKNKLLKMISSTIFIVAEIGLLIAVMATSGNLNNWLCFSSVLLAFVFSLMWINFKNKNFLTQFALFFTVIADIFLVLISPQNQAVAMTAFSIVQILYLLRILKETNNKKINLINLIVRVVMIVLVEIITIIVVKDKIDYVCLISMFYYTNLILNLVFACVNFKRSPLLAIGLVFFLLCDTFVGLSSAIDVYITVSHNSWLYRLVFADFNFIWFFYIPSQTLLALSLIKCKKN
ncbi:MAG: hypothetical protein IJ415_00830 [Clostridia bacterium]|nr:hypothetical protein [Clostridia bacterium]